MIEIVYKKENEDSNYQDAGFKLPKNIKQIGGGESDTQVYMEDNVALYLSKVPDREEDIRYGVLVGEVKRSCGYTYIFINGAIDVREVFDNTVIFGDDTWTSLNDDIYRYFSGSKVVGWFLSQSYSNSNQSMWIKKMHLNNFAGLDKVFFKIDRDEDDESFYIYGNETMEKLPCYHIYYEKNVSMEEYMLGTNADINFKKSLYTEERSGIIERKVSEIKNSISNKVDNKISKKETEKESPETEIVPFKKYNKMLSRAASFFVIGALATTIAVMGKQGKLDNLSNEFKSMVNGIINNGDSVEDGSGILSVNGVPVKESTGENNDVEKDTTDNNETTTNKEDTTDNKEEATTNEEETTTPTAEEQTASVIPAATKNYMVEKGETLYSICKKLYGNADNINTIIELNNLESADAIYYGKNLIVP